MAEPVSGEILVRILAEDATGVSGGRAPSVPGTTKGRGPSLLDPEQRELVRQARIASRMQREMSEYLNIMRGGTPKDTRKGGRASLLSPEQKEQLSQAREGLRMQREVGDYNKYVRGETKQQGVSFAAIRKWLPIIGIGLTAGELVRHSKIMSSSIKAFMDIFGALIDIFLIPLLPLLMPILKGLASIIPPLLTWIQKLNTDFFGAMEDLFVQLPKWIADGIAKLIPDIFGGGKKDETRGPGVGPGGMVTSGWWDSYVDDLTALVKDPKKKATEAVKPLTDWFNNYGEDLAAAGFGLAVGTGAAVIKEWMSGRGGGAGWGPGPPPGTGPMGGGGRGGGGGYTTVWDWFFGGKHGSSKKPMESPNGGSPRLEIDINVNQSGTVEEVRVQNRELGAASLEYQNSRWETP